MIHPAIKLDFSDMIEEFEKRVERNLLRKDKNDQLTLYNYTTKCQYGWEWDDYTTIARGIIVDSKRIVALTFPKCFNYYPDSTILPDCEYTIWEKLDGIFGSLFNYNGEWMTSTRGIIRSRESSMAYDWINNNIHISMLDPNYTYVYEIVFPSTQIILKYEYTGLVLLTMYNIHTGKELDQGSVQHHAKQIGFLRPRQYVKPIQTLIKEHRQFPPTIEGYMVLFDDGTRVKFKGNEYKRMSRSLDTISPVRVWKQLRDMKDIEHIISLLPDVYINDFMRIIEIYTVQFYRTLDRIYDMLYKYSDMSNKHLGLNKHRFDDFERTFIFMARKYSFLEELFGVESRKPPKLRKKFFEQFKPEGNVLPGYTPCINTDRFTQRN